MATMVWLFPQATVLTLSGLRALTQDGFKILSLWPKPNCPNSLLPNVNKRPVWVTTAVCSSPQDMATRKEKDQITGLFRQKYLFSFMLLNHNDLIKVWFIQVTGLGNQKFICLFHLEIFSWNRLAYFFVTKNENTFICSAHCGKAMILQFTLVVWAVFFLKIISWKQFEVKFTYLLN